MSKIKPTVNGTCSQTCPSFRVQEAPGCTSNCECVGFSADDWFPISPGCHCYPGWVRLTAEVEQLKLDNDAMYRAGASDGYACAGIEVRAKWQAVVEAARDLLGRHEVPINLQPLDDAIRALDGEP